MKKMFFKCIVLLLVVSMLAIYMPQNAVITSEAYSFTGQDVNTTSNIMYGGVDTGVDYTYVHLGSGGSSGFGANRKINIVEANLSDNDALSFEVMNNGTYLKNAVPLTTVVESFDEDNLAILAAVNGDWMTFANSLGASVTSNYRVTFSSMISDGEIWCSQMTSYEQSADYFTFGMTTDKDIVIGKPKINTTITNVSTGSSYTATGINRAPMSNTLVVFNNRLNDSNYVNSDAYEVVITVPSSHIYLGETLTGTVSNIYPAGTTSRGMLDDNTIVITARGSKISTIKGKFSIGNKVSISTSMTDSTYGNNTKWAKCEEAIGGQCLVMRNGSVNNDLSAADRNQYPTGILGYKSDKTIMMSMVTSDTNGNYVGLDFNGNIDTFCKAVGYDTCFLLDGGGSTTMITLEDGQYVERACYADGSIRSTWNSCAIVYDAGSSVLPSTIRGTVFDPQYYYAKNTDLQTHCGQDETKLLDHFVNYGIKEGRQASPLFAIDQYINGNGDLKAAFGFTSADTIETQKEKRLSALSHFAANGAFNDSANRHTVDATATGLADEFYAQIQLTNADLNLSLLDTAVIAYTPSDKPAQVWHFIKQTNGSYKIINTKNDYVLEVANGVKTSGAGIQISATDDNSSKQRWNIYEKIDYSGNVIGYILRSVISPACVLSVASSSPTASTAVQNNSCTFASSQVFDLNVTQIVENTDPNPETGTDTDTDPDETPEVDITVTPADVGTGFYAQIATKIDNSKGVSVSGSNAELDTFANLASQLWYFEKQSDGSYTIKNQATGKLLSVENSSENSGANVILADANASLGQKWCLYEGETGYYEFVPLCATGCALDVNGAINTDGTNIGIYTRNQTSAQYFSLLKGDYINMVKAENIGTDFIGHITTADGTNGLSNEGINSELDTANSNDKKQLFYFAIQDDGSYKITSTKNGYVLTADGDAVLGTNVVLSIDEGSVNQRWFVIAKEGKYILKNAGADDVVLGLANSANTSGANVQLSTFTADDSATIFNITNLGVADYDIPAKTTTGVLSDSQVTAVYESLCASNSSCSSISETALKQMIAEYALEAFNLGVTEIRAVALCVNIRYLSNSSELSRVIDKAGNPTLDNIYASLLTDTGSQVGTYRVSHLVFYNFLFVKF